MNQSRKNELLLKYGWLELGDDLFKSYPNPLQELISGDSRLLENPQRLMASCMSLCPLPDVELLPFQALILSEIWNKPFPMLIASRGGSKTFLMAIYSILRCLLMPNRKVVVVGAAFRQAKYVMQYCEVIWDNAPVLTSLYDDFPPSAKGMSRDPDRWKLRMGTSTITALPIGTGEKIRGERANDIIADEFAALTLEIYETVIHGFAAVASNPVANVKDKITSKIKAELGIDTEERLFNNLGNQSVISGTAYYDFNHFADYFKKYRAILRSRGDKHKLARIFDSDEEEVKIDYKDYVIFRIPQELLPLGFLDEKHISRAKATVHSGIYEMEYSAIFSKDSQGFFKRTLIESCVSPVEIFSGTVNFTAMLRGRPGYNYVIGIDPAADRDNFAIVVIEINNDHTRMVYCWSTNKTRHKELLKQGLTTQEEYYGFCCRKIRELMKRFRCVHISCDSQGGGASVEEILHDEDKMSQGEQRIWQIIEEDKEKDTDDKAGLHILEMINFAKADWTNDANHGLRNDMEHKFLLFPQFDSISLESASLQDQKAIKAGDKSRVYDTMEDCVFEIEELKNELTTIVMTQTSISGRDRWDTPEIKLPGGRKGRLVKDRYSALIMANMAARSMHRADSELEYNVVGQAVSSESGKQKGNLYIGAEWFVSGMGKGGIVGVVKR